MRTAKSNWNVIRLALNILALGACAVACYGLDPTKDIAQFGRQSWQSDSGLPQNTVHSIVQSREGYLWFATEGGLVRFDGVQFAVYNKQSVPALPGNVVTDLFRDHAGDLWIGTSAGLVRRSDHTWQIFTTSDGLPADDVDAVLEDTAGEIWAVTSSGIASFSGNKFHPVANLSTASPGALIPVQDGLLAGTPAGLARIRNGTVSVLDRSEAALGIQWLAVGADGTIWAGGRAGLRSYTSDGRLVRTLNRSAGLPSDEITALLAGSDRRLWIGTSDGLAVLTDNKIATYSPRDGLPSGRIESIFQDREGAIWVGTHHGVARVYGGKISAFTPKDGLSGNLVLSFYEDREGDLWLGTETGGVNVLREQKFTTYTSANGLSDDETRSIVQASDGSVWVGTNGGGLSRFSAGRFTSLSTHDGLSSNIVLALGAGKDGTLWAGTPDGLNRIRDGHIQVFTSADGLADDFVRSVYPASDGSLWIGTRRGLSHFADNKFTTYTKLDGLGSDLVGAIVQDRTSNSGANQGALWIGTLGGLTRYADAKFTNYTTRNGLTADAVTALHADAEGTIWIGAKDGGLHRFRNGEITAYPAAANNLPENIYAILEDGSDNLWLSSNSGIYRVSKKELDDYAAGSRSGLHPTIYGTADGMKISECSSGGHPAASKLSDGSMWFATLRGIAAIDPQHLALNTVPPPVVIERVLVDDKDQPEMADLTLPPGNHRVSFDYAGLSFVAPQKVHYKYQVQGFDKHWIDAGALRTASYTNLPPGRYRFRVVACNNDGVWNDAGAALSFRLQPRFYQTYWFYFAVALGIGLLIYALYRFRLRQTELRFAAVLNERSRIAREIHDTLAQSLVGISVQLELVSRLLNSSVDSAREHLDQVRILVRNSITEARTSIWELRSQAVENPDLASRLSKMANDTTASTPIRVQASMSGAYRPLKPQAESELLKIAQEAVNNAVRHASPTRIAIELHFDPRQLQMTIRDDGRGFDPSQNTNHSGPHGHYGLTGMRERAELIGGTLIVDSAPGQGTEISVQVAIDD